VNIRNPAWWAVIALSTALAVAGCKSYWVSADVVNETGQPIHELEVAYPTASFGINSLAPGATMHYRLQVRGSGPMKVEYTNPDGKTVHAEGTTLSEHQQGAVTIRLLPGGKAEFVPHFQPNP
jgi:hypothetical protein